MDALLIAALAKDLEKAAKAGRDGLAPGKHVIDATITLNVKGAVTVADDTTYIPTANIPIKAAMALFMRYAGVTGPAAMDALVRAMTEAAALDDDAADTIAEMADIARAEADVKKALKALPPAKRKGAVKVAVAVTEVAAADIAKAA